MDKRQKLIEIFWDTQNFYTHDQHLSDAITQTKSHTKFYEAKEYPEIHASADNETTIHVTRHKTFEAAMKLRAEQQDWRICVLNFASAVNPGGGVKKGASAQEESLCRCSTLYPALTQDQLWRRYYLKNRDVHNKLHTDACIYTPDIVICKTDDDYPKRMQEGDWVTVDVISCAAPNLRNRKKHSLWPEEDRFADVTQERLYDLHVKRAEHILHVAVANGADAMILGAFGCGAFANDPKIVARAYKDALQKYGGYFKYVEFAIYCRDWETENYDAFQKELLPYIRAFEDGAKLLTDDYLADGRPESISSERMQL